MNFLHDITYLAHILENGPLGNGEMKAKVKEIREIRNNLSHTTVSEMNEAAFKKMKKTLIRAIEDLVEPGFEGKEEGMKKFMADTENFADPAAISREDMEELTKEMDESASAEERSDMKSPFRSY